MNRVGEVWEIRGFVHVCLGEDPTDPRLYELVVLNGEVRGSPTPHGRCVYVYKSALDQPPPEKRKRDWWRRLA